MLSRFVRKWVILLSIKIFGNLLSFSKVLAYFSKKGNIPPIRNKLLYLSATKLADGIRKGNITSESVIRAYILRCQEVNPIINAIVDSRFDQAFEEAKKVDLLIASKSKSLEELEKCFPLLGVPVTIKESIGVKGLSHQAGRFMETPQYATEDADCVRQLKEAGAIILLVSNTPELCMNIDTFNYVTGTTKNPYDLRRTVGGSSGGEAALLSSAASVIGIGSDMAGSLRIPAMYCGIFGYKGSSELVSTVGHIPSSTDPMWNKIFCLGPLVRYAEDLPLVMKVIKKPESPRVKSIEQVSLSKINFFYKLEDTSGATNTITKNVLKAMEKVVQYFQNNQRFHIQEANLKHMDNAFEFSILKYGKLKGVFTVLSDPHDNDYSKWRSLNLEQLKKIFGLSYCQTSSLLYCMSCKFFGLFPERVFDEAFKLETMCERELSNLLKDNGVLFYPVLPYTAHFHGDYLQRLWDTCYVAMFNILGYPSISCPVGFTEDGLPVGVQIVANRGCDHLLMAVAKEMEAAFGGWTPPK